MIFFFYDRWPVAISEKCEKNQCETYQLPSDSR